MSLRTADRVHAVFMTVSALGVLAYWLVYFTSGATHVRSDDVYISFENSFPLADGYMSLCFLLAAVYLWQGRRQTLLWGIAAGSTMLYLACMDFLFNLEQGHFHLPLSPEMLAECVIVAWCASFGPFTVWRLWRHPLAASIAHH
jgi:hypothetical protein